MMYTIGQFSMATRLSVRTLRRYHEQGLLIPDHVDEDSGYRYYRESAVERARIITALRELEFSLAEIGEILAQCEEDEDMLDFLIRRRDALEDEQRKLQKKRRGVAGALEQIQQRRMSPDAQPAGVFERNLEAVLFCGLRTQGRWQEIGGVFQKVARRLGGRIAGPGMALCYDGEYKDEGADYEAGFPVRRPIDDPELHCRELPALRCLSLIYTGPYERIDSGYERILGALNERGLAWNTPTREIYHKGPGMFFRGTPEKYRTELVIPLAEG